MIVVHGLKNCNTCKKALVWLKGEGIEHRFHDVRAGGLDGKVLAVWLEELGHELLVNTRGTTWRALPDPEKVGLDNAKAHHLIMEQPAIMKRPVFDLGDRRVVGFKNAQKVELART